MRRARRPASAVPRRHTPQFVYSRPARARRDNKPPSARRRSPTTRGPEARIDERLAVEVVAKRRIGNFDGKQHVRPFDLGEPELPLEDDEIRFEISALIESQSGRLHEGETGRALPSPT